ncbi:head-tail adaptor protein [Pasteurellaceae bacterium 15-036681]|nr:head-tail adaptor protein [Pasteurellaceae bacterium 15-036681]
MNIGRLRHRIKIQTLSNRPNDYGATIAEWRDKYHVWAEVKPLSGREFFGSNQIHSEATTQIWLRYIPNIDRTMRVKFNQRLFEIVAVINYKEQNRTLLLQCKELDNGER